MEQGVSRDECTSVLSTDLYPGATTVIQYLTPTEVAQGQAKHSGDSDAKNKEDGLSLGAKIGIAIGAVAIVVLITGAIAFFILRKRRAAKLSAAQRSGDFSKPTPGHYEPPTGVATSQYDPGSPAPPAYASPVAQYGQPGMPNERSEYYKAPIAGAGTPYQNNAETYRQDGGQVAEMPVPEPQVYEMGASEPEKKS